MSDPCADGHEIEAWRGRDICITCGYTDTPGLKEPAMEHDPKCPSKSKDISSPITCTFCQVIRSVREEYIHGDVQGYPI